MTRIFLAAGVAALAITVPATAQDRDRGGRDRGAQVEKKRGAAKAERTERRGQRTERAARNERVERRAERPERAARVERSAQRVERPERATRVERNAQRVERVAQRDDRPDRTDRVREQRTQRVERVNPVREQRAQRIDRVERIANRDARQLARIDERRERQLDRIADRNERQLARVAETRVVPLREWEDLARGGIWLNGCPPGLAKKPVACVPPGQLKNVVGLPLSTLDDRILFQDVPSRLRYVYQDTDDYYYRYGNGYIYRVDRGNDLISALLPLFGLGLTVGQPFPTSYSNYYMPMGLQSFYPDSPYTSYRYANGYVYEIDPFTGLIEDVDPMLGYGYGYGQIMPATYSAYNVPYQYRDYFYDTSDSYYRYAPGAIYQVDPTTSLITAVAALLTNGMTVGQPMPMGYGAYNVPYQYRSTYFDTPDHWYRYSNGHIYQIDPRTQLVTALVASILT